MRKVVNCGLIVVLVSACALAAEDVETAVVGTVKTVDKGTKTVVVKTADGTEQTFRVVGRTVAHGAEATGKGTKDALGTIKEGDEVAVHYTVKGSEKTAREFDRLGRDGMKSSVVAVKSVDHAAKIVVVKTAEGGEETYHLADSAAHETGEGLEKAGRVTVYYTEDAGKKIAHFFKN